MSTATASDLNKSVSTMVKDDTRSCCATVSRLVYLGQLVNGIALLVIMIQGFTNKPSPQMAQLTIGFGAGQLLCAPIYQHLDLVNKEQTVGRPLKIKNYLIALTTLWSITIVALGVLNLKEILTPKQVSSVYFGVMGAALVASSLAMCCKDTREFFSAVLKELGKKTNAR